MNPALRYARLIYLRVLRHMRRRPMDNFMYDFFESYSKYLVTMNTEKKNAN